MKVSTDDCKPEFQPFSVTITFETEAEAEAMGFLTAYAGISETIHSAFGLPYEFFNYKIRKALRDKGVKTGSDNPQFITNISIMKRKVEIANYSS